MMWMGANHMCHDASTRCGDWSDTERNSMIGLASGYVLVKLVAGVHAGYATGEYNRDHERLALPMIRPTSGGAVFSWGASF